MFVIPTSVEGSLDKLEMTCVTIYIMNIINYLKEVRVELTKVTWPTRKEATHLTLIILGASLAVGLYVGGLDYIFTSLLGTILK